MRSAASPRNYRIAFPPPSATFAWRAARLPLNRPRYTEASETGIQLWKLEKLQAEKAPERREASNAEQAFEARKLHANKELRDQELEASSRFERPGGCACAGMSRSGGNAIRFLRGRSPCTSSRQARHRRARRQFPRRRTRQASWTPPRKNPQPNAAALTLGTFPPLQLGPKPEAERIWKLVTALKGVVEPSFWARLTTSL